MARVELQIWQVTSGALHNRHPSYNNNRGRLFQGYDEYENKCQICKNNNHIAKDCDWRYAENNSQRKKVAAATDTSYGIDCNWYVDSGATNHITNELEKVNMSEKYHGHDQVHNANSVG